MRRFGFPLALFSGVALAMWALWPAPDADPAPPTAQVAAPQPVASAAVHPASPFGSGAPVLGPDRTAEETRAVASRVQRDDGRPDSRAAREAAQKAFQEGLERFGDLLHGDGGASTAELQSVARALDKGLDQQLKHGDVDFGDAQMLKADLLDVLVPDPAQRGLMLVKWREGQDQPGAAPLPPSDPRTAEYKRKEAEALIAWQAQPSDLRDSDDLAEQLDELRNSVFPR
jgi:hypothetical protein